MVDVVMRVVPCETERAGWSTLPYSLTAIEPSWQDRQRSDVLPGVIPLSTAWEALGPTAGAPGPFSYIV